MASRKDRFGGLGDPQGAGSGRNADLFEHYGIDFEPARGETATAATDARPCRRCGWFLTLAAGSVSCPLCAAPDPLAEPAKTT